MSTVYIHVNVELKCFKFLKVVKKEQYIRVDVVLMSICMLVYVTDVAM